MAPYDNAAPLIGCGDDPGDDGQDDQPLHVVDDRGAEDDPGFVGVRPPEILHHARGDADARGGQRRAEKDVRVDARARQQPRAHAPAKDEGADDAQRRHHEGGEADLHHLRHGGLEADLEEQQDDAEAGEHIHGDVGPQVVEPVESRQREIPEHDARRQLSEHWRLTEHHREMRADLRGQEDDRQRKNQPGDRIPMDAADHGVLPAPETRRRCLPQFTRPARTRPAATAQTGATFNMSPPTRIDAPMKNFQFISTS